MKGADRFIMFNFIDSLFGTSSSPSSSAKVAPAAGDETNHDVESSRAKHRFSSGCEKGVTVDAARGDSGSRSSTGMKSNCSATGISNSIPPRRGRQPQRDRITTGNTMTAVLTQTTPAASQSCPPSLDRSGHSKTRQTATNAKSSKCNSGFRSDPVKVASVTKASSHNLHSPRSDGTNDPAHHNYRDRSCPPTLTSTRTGTTTTTTTTKSNVPLQPGRNQNVMRPNKNKNCTKKTKDLVSVVRNRPQHPHRLSSLFGGQQQRHVGGSK